MSEPASEPFAQTEPVEITLLTQDDCGFCEQAKQVLDRVGADFPLQVTEIDLATDEGRRLAAQAGVLFAPGILVNGQPFSFGRLSERKLRRTLRQHSLA
ncbi:glutaredoxin family protein [Amycolatopsis saalfeldensis]|uniref:Glutaredoxin n=1 Tax=Amycolatopsis saalfeldensis TaxID=394193 RepID=A0A1H8YMR5_9PSEU|nr:glutaredoxin family protein [Amycolatopsis saalfeldensis]SEP53332.1 Glutaredoxin [Amycolatopsis saalfeldensis]